MNVKWGITVNRQGVDVDGTLNCTAKSEEISDRTATVAASEAVLITFDLKFSVFWMELSYKGPGRQKNIRLVSFIRRQLNSQPSSR